MIQHGASSSLDGGQEGSIIFARSTDSGSSWQSTFQFDGQTASLLDDDNDGQLANGLPSDVAAGQIMPRLVADAQGDVALVWYDTRHDPSNRMLDVYATVSTDGGKTFSPNFRVTESSFDPNLGKFTNPAGSVSLDSQLGKFTDATGGDNSYLGDAIGMALAGNVMYAAWTDTRHGDQDIFFSRVSLDPIPALRGRAPGASHDGSSEHRPGARCGHDRLGAATA